MRRCGGEVTCAAEASAEDLVTSDSPWARSHTCTDASAAKRQQVNVRHFISRLIRSFIMSQRGHTCLRLQGPAVHVAACTCMCAALFHLAGF